MLGSARGPSPPPRLAVGRMTAVSSPACSAIPCPTGRPQAAPQCDGRRGSPPAPGRARRPRSMARRALTSRVLAGRRVRPTARRTSPRPPAPSACTARGNARRRDGEAHPAHASRRRCRVARRVAVALLRAGARPCRQIGHERASLRARADAPGPSAARGWRPAVPSGRRPANDHTDVRARARPLRPCTTGVVLVSDGDAARGPRAGCGPFRRQDEPGAAGRRLARQRRTGRARPLACPACGAGAGRAQGHAPRAAGRARRFRPAPASCSRRFAAPMRLGEGHPPAERWTISASWPGPRPPRSR